MKRYDNIKARSRKADAEQQFINSAAELAYNLAELGSLGALRGNTQRVTCPVLNGNEITFRVGIFEKGTLTEKEVLTIIAQGNTYDERVLIFNEDDPILQLWEVKKSDKSGEVEEE